MSDQQQSSGSRKKRKRKHRKANSPKSTTDTSASDSPSFCKKGKKVEKVEMATSDITSQLLNIQETLARIDERSEKIEGAIFDLQLENEALKKQVAQLLKERSDLSEENEKIKATMRKTNQQLNNLEQWTRKWNLRIWGLKDEDRETTETSAEKVVGFLRFELGLSDMTTDKIDIAHRLGKYRPNEDRAIIVRFLRLSDRTQVLRVRSRLRGKQYGVAEDLTATNYKLLNTVRERAGRRNAWTRDGVIFAKLQSGRIVKIDESTPLTDYFDTLPPHGMPHRQDPSRSSKEPHRADVSKTGHSHQSFNGRLSTPSSAGGAKKTPTAQQGDRHDQKAPSSKGGGGLSSGHLRTSTPAEKQNSQPKPSRSSSIPSERRDKFY